MFLASFLLALLREIGWPRKKGLPFFRTSYYSLAVLERTSREVIRVGLILGDDPSRQIVTEIMTEKLEMDVSEIEEGKDLDIFLAWMDVCVEDFLETQKDSISIYTDEDSLLDWEKAGFIEESDDLWSLGFNEMQARFLGALWLALTNEGEAIEEEYEISSSDWLLATSAFVEYERLREKAGKPPLKDLSPAIRSLISKYN